MKILEALRNKEKGNGLADRLVNVRKVASDKLGIIDNYMPQITAATRCRAAKK